MSDAGKKIILLAVAVVLALGAGEVVLRAIGYGTITPEMNFGVNTRLALDQGRFLPDADLFWKLPPSPRDREIRAVQPDVPVPPKSRRRILVMGDSCSRLSMAVPPYSALLEDSLRAHDVEVFNAAVPGYTTWQGRAWLARQLLALKPDVTVVYFGWNDHWRATGITDRDYAARLQSSSLRLGLLWRRMPDPPPLRVPPTDFLDNLEAIVAELAAAGSDVLLVTAPANLTQEARARILQTRYLVRGDDAVALHRDYLAKVRQAAEDSPADVLDAAVAFAAAGDPRLLLMRDGIHPTDTGHRLLASLLAARLDPVLAGAGPVPDTEALTRRAREFMRTGVQP